nr:hypothetical protein Iba_chr04dCG9350 [Ipomoea batatas]
MEFGLDTDAASIFSGANTSPPLTLNCQSSSVRRSETKQCGVHYERSPGRSRRAHGQTCGAEVTVSSEERISERPLVMGYEVFLLDLQSFSLSTHIESSIKYLGMLSKPPYRT